MELSVAYLGTGGPAPTRLRGLPSVLISREGFRIMVDCGEGTQRQMRLSTGLVRVDEIYLTHFHLDHCMGIPGLLKTYDLNDREEPIRILGPIGTAQFMEDLRPFTGRLGFHVEVEEISDRDVVGYQGFEVEAFETAHRTTSLGYAILEDDRPGKIDPDEAARLGVSDGPSLGALQDGRSVTGEKGEVRPEQVMGEDRPGRAVVVTGDTGPSARTVEAAAEADLLIHDSSFLSEDSERAAETAHSTAAQAAGVAAEAGVKMLSLVHISARYHVGAVVEEARETFADTNAPRDYDLVRIPFPEKGPPELVREGAIRSGEPEE